MGGYQEREDWRGAAPRPGRREAAERRPGGWYPRVSESLGDSDSGAPRPHGREAGRNARRERVLFLCEKKRQLGRGVGVYNQYSG